MKFFTLFLLLVTPLLGMDDTLRFSQYDAENTLAIRKNNLFVPSLDVIKHTFGTPGAIGCIEALALSALALGLAAPCL